MAQFRKTRASAVKGRVSGAIAEGLLLAFEKVAHGFQPFTRLGPSHMVFSPCQALTEGPSNGGRNQILSPSVPFSRKLGIDTSSPKLQATDCSSPRYEQRAAGDEHDQFSL